MAPSVRGAANRPTTKFPNGGGTWLSRMWRFSPAQTTNARPSGASIILSKVQSGDGGESRRTGGYGLGAAAAAACPAPGVEQAAQTTIASQWRKQDNAPDQAPRSMFSPAAPAPGPAPIMPPPGE